MGAIHLCRSKHTNPSYLRNNLSDIIYQLKDCVLHFTVEISVDKDYIKRRLSAETFFEYLKNEGVTFITTYKVLHKKEDYFCVQLNNGQDKKIVFSSCDSHRDSVVSFSIGKLHYLPIINKVVKFLELSQTQIF